MDTVKFLAGVELFAGLPEKGVRRLAVNMRHVSFKEGSIIEDANSIDGLYVLKRGIAKVTKSSSDASGVEAVLSILREGDTFGELGLIDGLPRSAKVTAMSAVECYFLPRAAFLIALRENPGIARCMLPTLAGMVRTADRWVGELFLGP